jgi:catabolite regulation protein CreA
MKTRSALLQLAALAASLPGLTHADTVGCVTTAWKLVGL